MKDDLQAVLEKPPRIRWIFHKLLGSQSKMVRTKSSFNSEVATETLSGKTKIGRFKTKPTESLLNFSPGYFKSTPRTISSIKLVTEEECEQLHLLLPDNQASQQLLPDTFESANSLNRGLPASAAMESGKEKEGSSLRMVLACIIANLPSLSVGLATGFSAILIPQVSFIPPTRAIYHY